MASVPKPQQTYASLDDDGKTRTAVPVPRTVMVAAGVGFFVLVLISTVSLLVSINSANRVDGTSGLNPYFRYSKSLTCMLNVV